MSRGVAAAIWISMLFATGCTGPSDSRERVVVFAASSMSDALRAMEADFESVHPNWNLEFSFAGSQALRLAIEQGAPADVFVSANSEHLSALHDGGFVGAGRSIAENDMVLIVPAENPRAIEQFRDLDRAERIVLGHSSVPAGRYAEQVLGLAGKKWGAAFADRVEAAVVSREPNVRLVRAKVEWGEADAGIVYRSDAAHCEGVTAFELGDDLNVDAHVLAAPVRGSQADRGGEAFLDYLASAPGQETLLAHGFRGGQR